VAEVTKPVVVLFDVDETLVHTGGSGARSWKTAFEKLYGMAGGWARLRLGNSYRWVSRSRLGLV
jgi:phosphoglycolate phosphatase-like HAD superfamily hydrolase